MTVGLIETTTHGRYLAEPAQGEVRGMLVGFHGYGEDAGIQMERLGRIPGSAEWVRVSIQGLHRFYSRRNDRVVASWMTSQDRDLAIADNLEYVRRCLDAARAEFGVTGGRVVFAGFSQGVAMAFRATAAVDGAGVVAVGGDIPPELGAAELGRLAGALLVRGSGDTWYTTEKWRGDEARLAEADVAVRALEFDGGHEWTPWVDEQIGEWLRGLRDAADV